MNDAEANLVPGRSCDDCTMCCKLLLVKELNKPDNVWCDHCTIGEGCQIYDKRPEDCRTFYCGWRLDARIPDEWWPAKSKMVVKFEIGRIVVFLDRDRKDAWRKEPFNGLIRQWAKSALPYGGEVLVTDGRTALRIHPAGETALRWDDARY
jgi:hypothetical protein